MPGLSRTSIILRISVAGLCRWVNAYVSYIAFGKNPYMVVASIRDALCSVFVSCTCAIRIQIHPGFKQCRITKALDLSSTIDLFMQERLRSG